jgi:tetratricopeptide (TPR) repeat protein
MNMVRNHWAYTAFGRACALLGNASIALALGLVPLVLTAMPANPEAAARAKYTCPKVTSDADRRRVATALSAQTSDKNALACAADLRYELTVASPSDLNGRIAALESLASYIDLVHSLKLFDLVRVNWAEYALRLEHASKLASELLPTTRKTWPNEPATIILTAEIESSLAGPSDPQITLAAIAEFKKAIALDPKALHGEGQLLIGRKYLDLPPLFGGDTKQAVLYLERAREIAPEDPRAMRYLAEAYDELGNHDAALVSLRALAAVKPRSTDLQLYADEWRTGEGLATRMDDPALADRFAALRADLMHQHPNILLRKVPAVFGHGGDDPMTGTPQYRGELTNTH